MDPANIARIEDAVLVGVGVVDVLGEQGEGADEMAPDEFEVEVIDVAIVVDVPGPCGGTQGKEGKQKREGQAVSRHLVHVVKGHERAPYCGFRRGNTDRGRTTQAGVPKP